MTAPLRIYPYEPSPKVDLPDIADIPMRKKRPTPGWPLPFLPNFRGLPPANKPTIDGYPWWWIHRAF